MKVLCVGGTGSVGREVVSQAVAAGHEVRVLTRGHRRNAAPSNNVQIIHGDLTDTNSLAMAVDGIDGIVFTAGAGGSSMRNVDYGGVYHILRALGPARVRFVLMTAIGDTARRDYYDWKRRSERLVRASGNTYTIVRPGWFDANGPDQHRVHFLQGDTRHAESPADGVISRHDLAHVLVASLTLPSADHKTFELVAEQGPGQADLEPVFAALRSDVPGQLDGALDQDNMPVQAEPPWIQDQLESVRK